MGYSIDVYDHDFEEEVLAKSRDIPVIVDFFATWCGPCQMLKPMLEKVAQEYDCVVAKVDTEQNQFLSQAYRIEGIPDVRIFCNGEIVDGFVGVLPEPQLQELLAKCGIRSRLDDEFAAVRQAMDSGDRDRAENLIARLLEAYPDNRNVLIEAARWLVRLDRLDRAEQLLAPIGRDEKADYARANAIRALIGFKQECANPTGDSELDRLFSEAACHAVEGNYEAALKHFIDIVGKDRGYKNDGARKAAIAIFDLLGDSNPLTATYRKQLMLAMY
jgi:putative thioredoxin